MKSPLPASGKIILLGELAVVYGKPGLAAGLARGAHASATPAAEAVLAVAPWGVEVHAARTETDAEREMLRVAFAALLAGYAGAPPALRVEATVELPSGAGLGASAALSVSPVNAISQAFE